MTKSEGANGRRPIATAAKGAVTIKNGRRGPRRVSVRSESRPTSTGRSTAISPSPPTSTPMTVLDEVKRCARTGRYVDRIVRHSASAKLGRPRNNAKRRSSFDRGALLFASADAEPRFGEGTAALL